jgi:hypothetical protein
MSQNKTRRLIGILFFVLMMRNNAGWSLSIIGFLCSAATFEIKK